MLCPLYFSVAQLEKEKAQLRAAQREPDSHRPGALTRLAGARLPLPLLCCGFLGKPLPLAKPPFPLCTVVGVDTWGFQAALGPCVPTGEVCVQEAGAGAREC